MVFSCGGNSRLESFRMLTEQIPPFPVNIKISRKRMGPLEATSIPYSRGRLRPIREPCPLAPLPPHFYNLINHGLH